MKQHHPIIKAVAAVLLLRSCFGQPVPVQRSVSKASAASVQTAAAADSNTAEPEEITPAVTDIPPAVTEPAVTGADYAAAVGETTTVLPFFETTARAPVSAQIALPAVQASPGGTVDVPVHLDQNGGIAALRLSVQYNEMLLTLTDVRDSGLLKGAEFTCSSDLSAKPFGMLWDIQEPYVPEATGLLAVLTFRISSLAAGNVMLKITGDAVDQWGEPVQLGLSNGTVGIIEQTGMTTTSVTTTTTSTRAVGRVTTTKLNVNLTASDVTVAKGDSVSVSVRLTQNDGLSALRLFLQYDRTKLKLTDVEEYGLLSGAVFSAGDSGGDPVGLLWDDPRLPHQETGRLMTLHFRILPQAEGITRVKLLADAVDVAVNPLQVSQIDEIIRLTDYDAPGDFDQDGHYLVADLVLYSRYLAEDTALTEAQVSGILNAPESDADGDGRHTLSDLTVLMQWLQERSARMP